MDRHISLFIKSNKILNLASCKNNEPYCSTCFYSFVEEKNWLVIKSSPETRHIKEGLSNPNVAGTIVASHADVSKMKGIQFTAKFIQPIYENLSMAQFHYYKQFPFALGIKGELWILELDFIKMTDNTLGFGKKVIWKREVLPC